MGQNFKFVLGQRVVIKVSGEEGEVIGRADYQESDNAYFVRFKDATGHAREAWWTELALS